MGKEYLDKTGFTYFWGKIKAFFQEKLVSGTNIKTINNESVLGSGNITVSGGVQSTWYGTSNTTASTAAKVVTCEGFTLDTGAVIAVLFTTANTAATPTLNVNSTGAKEIRIGNTAPNATSNALKWSANTVLFFVYDGTYFRYVASKAAGTAIQPDGAGSWYGTCSTAASTAAKTSSITNFRLVPGAVVHLVCSTANTYASGAITLNVNSTGAKNIYYNNAVTSASNSLLWDAGETVTFVYSGSYWYFVGKSKAPVNATLSNEYGFQHLSVGGVDLWDPIGAAVDYGTCPTADGTATKIVTTQYGTDYLPLSGQLIAITFDDSNTTEDAVQLNINDAGALPVYVNGVVTSSSNPLLWMAGETLLFATGYDSTTFENYYVFVARGAYNSCATLDDIDVVANEISTIGTRVTSGAESSHSASVSSGSSVALASISIDPGVWVVSAAVKFASNATGVRRLTVVGTSGSTSTNSEYSVISPAVSGTNTILNKTRIIAASTASTLYLTAYQNSGSALTAYATISAVRIK